MTITINGGFVNGETVGSVQKLPNQDKLHGKTVYLNPKGSIFLGSLNCSSYQFLWSGTDTAQRNRLPSGRSYRCVRGDPLTPVLPYRTSIKHDDKAERFLGFVRKEAAAWCMEPIRAFGGRPHKI